MIRTQRAHHQITSFLRLHQYRSYSIEELEELIQPNIHRDSLLKHTYTLLEQGHILLESHPSQLRLRYNLKELHDYLDIPYFRRTHRTYSKSFLRNYIPNKTPLLSEREIATLYECNKGLSLSTNYIKTHGKLYEHLLIDFSYGSSKLDDGASHTYSETMLLLTKGGTKPSTFQKDNSTILNHKRAFEYIVTHKHSIDLSEGTLRKLHAILGQAELNAEYLGTVRKEEILISGSSYSPPKRYKELKQETKVFFRKLQEIDNPFEQCFFILTFLPYLQLFDDINKRTSRAFCNIPLITNGMIPFSFMTMEKADYLKGLLAIYELREPELLKRVFIQSYKETYRRYFKS